MQAVGRGCNVCFDGAEGGEDELMQKTLEFQREIEPATDDDKYKQIVQNLVSYLARKMNVEK